MALLRCDVFSEALSLSTSMTVILPQPTTTQIGMTGGAGRRAPAGALPAARALATTTPSGCAARRSSATWPPLGLAVVMPQVHRSFYADEAYGGKYWTFVSQELPELVSRFFRVSASAARTRSWRACRWAATAR